jgi:hypothetical protein
MSVQKRRKPLGDSLASEFVYGTPATQEPTPTSQPEPSTNPSEKPTEKAEVNISPKPNKTKEDNILSRVLAPTEDRERMIRFTADLPETLHHKLTMLAARSGKKKVELVRAILEEVLKDVEE